MRLIIAGSRDFNDYDSLSYFVEQFIKDNDLTYDDLEIVSGHCKGVDLLGEQFAEEHNIPIKVFPANWKKYGRAAGPMRNTEMIKYANESNSGAVLAFWDGESKGTANTIRNSEKAGLLVETILYSETVVAAELFEGIYQNAEEELVFNFEDDQEGDIISLTRNKIYSSKHKGNVYYYGYRLNPQTPKSIRDKFLKYIKTDEATRTEEVSELINKCLDNFYEDIETNKIDLIVKIPSGGNLVNLIVNEINSNFESIDSITLEKRPTIEVEVDYDKYINSGRPKTQEQIDEFKKSMSAALKRQDPDLAFEIKQISTKYRGYIKQIFNFGRDQYDLTNVSNILIIDDIATSKNSLTMAAKLLREAGYAGNIYLFSLFRNS